MVGTTLHAIVHATQRELLLDRGHGGPMSTLPDKLGALIAATNLFRTCEIPYALIGGVAVGIRSGVPRATLDIDFAVSTAVDRSRMIEAFASHGFRLVGQFAHRINFTHESGEPVQIAMDAGFDAMIERAESIRTGDLELRVVTTPDLIAMKRRAAADPARRRSKALRDAADVALLEGDVAGDNEGW